MKFSGLWKTSLAIMAITALTPSIFAASVTLENFTFSPPVAKPGDEIAITAKVVARDGDLKNVKLNPFFTNDYPKKGKHLYLKMDTVPVGDVVSGTSKSFTTKVKLPADASLGDYKVGAQILVQKPNMWPYRKDLATIAVTQKGTVTPTPTVPVPTNPTPSIPTDTKVVIPQGMKLVFNDEFKTLDKSIWNLHGSITSTINNESEIYLPDQISLLNGGGLRITAEKKAQGNKEWSSGEITTHGSFAQTYGRFEIKMKMSKMGRSLWPAFWLIPENGAWPPELDVLEVVNDSANRTQLVMTPHLMIDGKHKAPSTAITIKADDDYHTYAMDWHPDYIKWYFDGKLLKTYTGPGIPDKPMYMIANVAIGGGVWIPKPNETTPLVTNMDIAYIRAFQFNDIQEKPAQQWIFSKMQPSAYTLRAGETLKLSSSITVADDITSKSFAWSQFKPIAAEGKVVPAKVQVSLPATKAGQKAQIQYSVTMPKDMAPGVYSAQIQVGANRTTGTWTYPYVENALMFKIVK